MRSRKSPASPPWMSILPRVDTSQTPTAERTVPTSRLTVSSQSASPTRIILGAHPGAGFHHHRALLRPIDATAAAAWVGNVAAVVSGKSAERDGAVGGR